MAGPGGLGRLRGVVFCSRRARRVLGLGQAVVLLAGLFLPGLVAGPVTANPGPSALTVTKLCDPADDAGKFNLQVDEKTVLANAACGDSRTVTVPPGRHSVGETAGSGTNLSNYTSVFSPNCAGHSITLAANQNATCTITNTRRPTLTVTKVCVPATDTGRFNLQIDGDTVFANAPCGVGTAVPTSVGTHRVSETGGPGTNLSSYTAVIDGGCDGTGAITLTAGQSTGCTITNTRIPPATAALTVAKACLPAGDPGRFNLLIDGRTVLANVPCGGSAPPVTVSVGRHIVSETADAGTNLINYNAAFSPNCPGGLITLAASQSAVCTIVNTRLPTLALAMVCAPDPNPGQFDLLIEGVKRGDASCAAHGVRSTRPALLSVGSHVIGETADGPTKLANYIVSYSANCAGATITLAAGQNAVCTITMTLRAPTLSVAKTDNSEGFGGSWMIGQTGAQYTIKVSNAGTAATFGAITMTDTLPVGLTLGPSTPSGTGWTCPGAVVGGTSFTCTTATAIAAAGSGNPISVSVLVGATTPTGTNAITNTAHAYGGGDPAHGTSATAVTGPDQTSVKANNGNTGVRIDSIAPTSAARGASVTISGSGFGSSGLIVDVGGVPAQVQTASDGSATFTVPANAALGDATVHATNTHGSTGSIGLTVLFDGNVTPVPDQAHAASATIGPNGGSITANGITLTVPVGALLDDTTITLTPLSSLGGTPFDQLIGAVDLQPQGLHFIKPATLTIPLPGGDSVANIVGFGFDGSGSSLHLSIGDVSGGSIALQIWHFSGGGAATATPTGVASMLTYAPTPWDQLANQLIAAALFDDQQTGADPNFDTRIDTDLNGWFVNSVLPNLNAAKGGTEQTLEQALAEWGAWKGEVQFLGRTGAFSTQDGQAETAATVAAANLADRLLTACDGSGVTPLAPLTAVTRIAAVSETLGLLIETKTGPSGKTLPTALGLAAACVHVNIESLSYPGAFVVHVVGALFKNTVKVDVGVQFWSNTIRHDLAVEISFDDVSGGPPANIASDTTTSGHTQFTYLPANKGHSSFAVTATLSQNPNAFAVQSFGVDVRDRIDLQSDATVQPGGTANLVVLLAGDGMANAAISYTVAGAGSVLPTAGTTDANGQATTVYTASSNAAGGSDTVTASFDDGSGAVTDHVTMTVTPVTVTVAPATTTINTGASALFTATVTGTATTSVTWTATGGTINSSGLYTAGSTAGTFTVTATSVADPTKSGSASVTVQPTTVGSIIWYDTFADASVGGLINGLDGPDVVWGDPAADSPEVNQASGGKSYSGGSSAVCPPTLGNGPASNGGSVVYTFTTNPAFAPSPAADPPAGTRMTIEAFGTMSTNADSVGCGSSATGQATVDIVFEVRGATVPVHLTMSTQATSSLVGGPNFASAGVGLTNSTFTFVNQIGSNGNGSDSRQVDLVLQPGFYHFQLSLKTQAAADEFGDGTSNTHSVNADIQLVINP